MPINQLISSRLETKAERRKAEREKRKRKRAEKREANGVVEESYSASRKKLKRNKMAESECRVGVVFDMSFAHLMQQKDLGKACKQLLRCYR